MGAAAAPLVTHVLGHEAEAFTQAVSPNDRIQVGIIGVGARIQGDVLTPMIALPGVEVIGVCDAYKGRVTRAQERLGSKAKEYPDYRALLADKSIDAVVIATPDHWHKQMAIEAFAAGKDVYLEKPMTYTIDEGPEMIAAAEKSGRLLQIGSQGIGSKLQQTAREITVGQAGADQHGASQLRPQHRLGRVALPHPARRRPEVGELGHVPGPRAGRSRSTSSGSSGGAASGTTPVASRPTCSCT